MTIKHSIKCNGYEVLVRLADEGHYHLTINAIINPLGYGNILETYTSKDEAIQASEIFLQANGGGQRARLSFRER